MTSAAQESLAEAKAKRNLLSVEVANNPSDRMDTPIHSEFSCQEDQEAGGTANRGRNEESGALLGEASAGTSHS